MINKNMIDTFVIVGVIVCVFTIVELCSISADFHKVQGIKYSICSELGYRGEALIECSRKPLEEVIDSIDICDFVKGDK